MNQRMLFVALVVLATAAAVVSCPAVFAQDAPVARFTISNDQLISLISLEATQNIDMDLANQLGAPVNGTWSGGVTSKGWSLTFNGTINGQDATITENGTLTKKTAQWTDSGSVGGTAVSGAGSVTFKGSTLDGSQSFGDATGTRPKDDIGWAELIACIGAPEACELFIVASEAIRNPASAYAVVSQLETSTGTLFGAAVEGSQVTTAQQGTLSSNGAVSYNAQSLALAGTQ